MSTKIKKDLTAIGSLKNLIVSLHLFFSIFSIFSISHCYALTVGDSYGGGTVFCVSQTADTSQCSTEAGKSGNHGLIMANVDQVNYDSNANHGVTWSSEYTEVPGARSDDDGKANTAAIIATLLHDNPGNNAAWLCHNYKDQEVHTDWYLPSKNELNKIYAYAKANNLIGKGCSGSKAGGVQCLVGGYDYDMVYWSSTESSQCFAWFQYFSSGPQDYSSEILDLFAARAIRAFNNLTIQQFNHLLLDLARRPDVKVLDLSGKDLRGNIEPLIDLLHRRPDFTAIDLSNCHLDEPSLRRVLEELQNNHVVTKSNVTGNMGAVECKESAVECKESTVERRHAGIVTDPGGPGFEQLEEQFRNLELRNINESLLLEAQNPGTSNERLRAIAARQGINQTILAAIVAHPHVDANTLLAVLQNSAISREVLNAVVHSQYANGAVLVAAATHYTAYSDLFDLYS